VRRTAIIILGLAFAVLATVGVVWRLLPNPAVTVSAASRVREGMSHQEVEQIFQGPPSGTMAAESCGDPAGARGCAVVQYWSGNHGEVQIGFD
jgi:hypothetical protein